jgi:hypothetical protein
VREYSNPTVADRLLKGKQKAAFLPNGSHLATAHALEQPIKKPALKAGF